jgi:hypothetical protein
MENGQFRNADYPDQDLCLENNQFLRNILAFEAEQNGPRRLLADLFPPNVTFPPLENLGAKEVSEKLAFISEFLGGHGVFLSFREGVPDAAVYEHLINEIFPEYEVPLERTSGFNMHLDGCDGYCPTCFQKDFCDVTK